MVSNTSTPESERTARDACSQDDRTLPSLWAPDQLCEPAPVLPHCGTILAQMAGSAVTTRHHDLDAIQGSPRSLPATTTTSDPGRGLLSLNEEFTLGAGCGKSASPDLRGGRTGNRVAYPNSFTIPTVERVLTFCQWRARYETRPCSAAPLVVLRSCTVRYGASQRSAYGAQHFVADQRARRRFGHGLQRSRVVRAECQA